MLQIIAIIVSVCIGQFGGFFSHMSLTSRPIFLGAVTGLLLGDLQTGILVGAQLELAFLGIVAIGATSAADTVTSTVMTVAFAVMNNLPLETVVPLGMTIGYAVTMVSNVNYVIAEVFVPMADKALENDEEKKFKFISIFGSVCGFFVIPCVICIAGISIGGPAVEAFVNNLPVAVMNGIGAAGAILPAMGIAMILTLILNKRVAIYFMAGFVVYKYLAVDMIFMLVIGLLLALIDFYYSSEFGKNKAVAAETNEEEDFLS